VENGASHLQGFTHRQPAWQGAGVGYQPGEYPPNAVDDLAGNNFPVLANAILFVAGVAAGPRPTQLPGLDGGALGALMALVAAAGGWLGRARSG